MSDFGSDSGAMVWGGEASSDERLFALVSHLTIFVLPVIAPLVIYFLKKDSSRFVSYHAMQAFIWQLIAYALGGTLCLGIGTLIGWVVAIMWALKANQGEWEGYPVIAGVGSGD